MVQSESATGSISRLFATAEVKSEDIEGLQLTGVYSGTRGGGFATITTRTGNVHVFPGDEVVPGIVLKHIERDRVILLVSGVEKELMFPETAAPAAESPPQTAPDRPRQALRPDQER
jgi:type II secretory pathway component PulC